MVRGQLPLACARRGRRRPCPGTTSSCPSRSPCARGPCRRRRRRETRPTEYSILRDVPELPLAVLWREELAVRHGRIRVADDVGGVDRLARVASRRPPRGRSRRGCASRASACGSRRHAGAARGCTPAGCSLRLRAGRSRPRRSAPPSRRAPGARRATAGGRDCRTARRAPPGASGPSRTRRGAPKACRTPSEAARAP